MNAAAVEILPHTRTKIPPVFVAVGFSELIVALCALFLADYLPIFNGLAVIAGAAGLLVCGYCVLTPQRVKVYDLLSAVLLLAYGSGTLNSVVAYGLDHQDLVGSSAPSQYWLTHTLSLVLAVCGVLHLAGRIDNDGHLLRAGPSNLTDRRRVLLLSVATFLLFSFLVFTGGIGFMATLTVAGGQEVSSVAVLALFLATPVGAIALSEALQRPRGAYFVALLTLAVLLLGFQFGLGRRIFLFSLINYVFCFLLVKRPTRLLTLRNVLLLGVALSALYLATTFFYAMRIAAWSTRGTHPSVIQLIPKALEVYGQDRRGSIGAKSAENVKTRTFVLQYLAQIAQGVAEREPLYGEDLHRALIVATPSLLYEEKFGDPLFMSEEPLINPQFGMPIFDGPNSILTAGMADFGEPGLFLYPLVFCVFLSLLLRWVYKSAPAVTSLLFGFCVTQIVLAVEVDISGYFSSLRTLTLVCFGSWIYFRWNNRMRPDEQRL